MAYQNILVQREDSVGLIQVNRPDKLNALNKATMAELIQGVDELGCDASIRAIIFTGAGEKSFVAGADIEELNALKSPVEAMQWVNLFHTLLNRIDKLEKPTIMAINGFALGGGCEVAMSGDIRIASDTARFGQPEINLGLIPGGQGTQRLPRLIGRGMAKFLIFTGDHIMAAEALRLGLVEQVVPAAELMATARALAQKLSSKSPVTLAIAKKAINEGMEADLQRGCELEVALFGVAASTEDRTEGTRAFLEKRKPVFKGR
ncbi:MAG TPA: enoyl-CoA hydratase-related protein [Dehalococcoidia bacterium]|nr:enoyl-CoA hydratase-related protein [Dehalococcoidia bacterium]